ncbi:hypothetical protein [Carboxydothermus ferrireducens]|uniref:Uncharacterized protein n=1 Tax=Carboxydothermus ferrireducens DSM 11255 TaxID=1119529 RepID=A0ABX2R7H7_9THEO|nr:hypothetical protein [Carboxydothermus ferrireducens]NYE57119.1 hypothetical protein [Carboxydothermus ferrireducens DSM 11255]
MAVAKKQLLEKQARKAQEEAIKKLKELEDTFIENLAHYLKTTPWQEVERRFFMAKMYRTHGRLIKKLYEKHYLPQVNGIWCKVEKDKIDSFFEWSKEDYCQTMENKWEEKLLLAGEYTAEDKRLYEKLKILWKIMQK